ncbi:MFS transporter [Brevibacillus composti]|uniref:MFS transporter n=1 Tax=Brevibacillus composti TaxID=2796470 RepID=A0A7T5EMZ8_9BACL|nr:MFS transporter [Brevibacillus composti]QQE75595.1 MFS transporter [Brevibacillus composti]QUO42621.1 MFS transporter [Brevibacillus composti]
MPVILKHPVFRRLYAAHIIHIIGNEFTFIAVVGLLHDLSGSGLSFAAGTVFRLLPYVMTSLFSGALLENWDKRRVMITVNLLRGILVSLFFWITTPAYLWAVFLLLILVNVCSAFFQPAMQVAIVSAVRVEERLQANSLLQGTTSFLIIVCQGVAAFLVYYFSYRFNFLLDAACYFVSLLILVKLPKLAEAEAKTSDGFFTRLREGFSYIRTASGIKSILAYQMAERILGAYYIMLMFHILQERQEGLYVFGLLDIPLGLGGVFAGIVVSKWAGGAGDKRVNQALGWALIAMGLAVYGIFHAGPILLLSFAVLLCAFASFSSTIMAVTRLQRVTEPDYLARVFSIREMATMGSFALGCLIVGYGAEEVGSPLISSGLAIFGAVAGTIWLIAARITLGKKSDASDDVA